MLSVKFCYQSEVTWGGLLAHKYETFPPNPTLAPHRGVKVDSAWSVEARRGSSPSHLWQIGEQHLSYWGWEMWTTANLSSAWYSKWFELIKIKSNYMDPSTLCILWTDWCEVLQLQQQVAIRKLIKLHWNILWWMSNSALPAFQTAFRWKGREAAKNLKFHHAAPAKRTRSFDMHLRLKYFIEG